VVQRVELASFSFYLIAVKSVCRRLQVLSVGSRSLVEMRTLAQIGERLPECALTGNFWIGRVKILPFLYAMYLQQVEIAATLHTKNCNVLRGTDAIGD
jgi:hypothetical protein